MQYNNPVLALGHEGYVVRGIGGQQQHIGGNAYFHMWKEKKKPPYCFGIDAGYFMADRRRTGWDGFIPDMRRYMRLEKDALLPSVRPPQEPMQALLLTHGHLDHDGSLPLLLTQGYRLPPIYCTPLVKQDLLIKCKEAGLSKEVIETLRFNIIRQGEWIILAPFRVYPIEVPHSYAGALAFYIEAPDGSNFFHSGDFKLDPTTPLGRMPDFAFLKSEIFKRRIALASIDSTNAPNATAATQEGDVKKRLLKLLADHPDKRLVCFLMSRNHQREATLCDIAYETGRVIEVTGMAIQTSARALKRSETDGYDLKTRAGGSFFNSAGTKTVAALYQENPGNLITLSTGTQGETMANLARAADGLIDDKLKLDPHTDIILVTATLIPGNEDQLISPLKKLLRKKFNVQSSMHVYGKDLQEKVEALKQLGLEIDTKYHASGHASAAEIETLISENGIAPLCVWPIHGSCEQMSANQNIAQRAGIKTLFTPLNGQDIRIFPVTDKGTARKPEFAGAVNHYSWFGVSNQGTIGSPHFIFAQQLTDTRGQANPLTDDHLHQVTITMQSRQPIRPQSTFIFGKGWKKAASRALEEAVA